MVSTSLNRPRSFAILLSLFSAVALTLAAVGIFGTLSFAVVQRTREIGVRLALGASRNMVLRTIVGEAFVLVIIGVGIGVTGALAAGRLLEAELFNLRPTDAVTFAAVVVTLGLTGLLASFIPAWRATCVDPLIALRAE